MAELAKGVALIGFGAVSLVLGLISISFLLTGEPSTVRVSAIILVFGVAVAVAIIAILLDKFSGPPPRPPGW